MSILFAFLIVKVLVSDIEALIRLEIKDRTSKTSLEFLFKNK